MMEILVRRYEPSDEVGWLRCRVLSFLDTAYFDNVVTQKEQYEHPAIELVAEVDNQIVGLLDVEYERDRGSVAYQTPKDPREGLGAVIHHVAVHPDYRRRGIGTKLLAAALEELRRNSIEYVEAWTRDDQEARRWYESNGFRAIESYLHVYLEGPAETKGTISANVPKLHVCHVFAHYVGSETETIRQRFRRVHECQIYRRGI